MKILDTFSGIGGFIDASHQVDPNVIHVGMCEIDKNCQHVLQHKYPNIQLFKDVTTLDTTGQSFDILVGGFPCFVAGTLIFTRSGYKPIEDIEIGEEVLTHNRRWRKVIQKHETHNRELQKVKSQGILTTYTTPEHPYYTRKRTAREYISKEKRSDNDNHYQPSTFSEPAFVESKDIKGLHIGVTYPIEIIETDKDHDHDYWWLIGRCLADGWCVKRKDRGDGGYAKVVLCAGKHENIEDRIYKVFHATKTEDRTTNKYHITNKDFTQEFLKAGIGAANKHIPNEWLKLPVDKLKSLLDGYISGDGSLFTFKSGKSGISITTVSQKMALTLQMAVLKVFNCLVSITHVKQPSKKVIEGREVNQRDFYSVRFCQNGRSPFTENGYGWGLCRKSEPTGIRATVYNIGVEEDESYIANGAIVHNCQAYSRNGQYYNHNNRTIPDSEERANLFLHLVRMLKTNQPRGFIFENVKELLTIKNSEGELFINVIQKELEEAGYNLKYQILCPTMFGIPQQRKRVFLVGIRSDLPYTFEFPKGNNPDSRVLQILENDVNEKYLLENLWKNRVLNLKPETTRLEALKNAYHSGEWVIPCDGYTNTISPVGIIYGDTPSGLPRQQDKLYSVYGISPTIATFSTPAFDCPGGWRVLTPRECFRLQSFPESHPILHRDSSAYKQAGNAVNVEVVKRVIQNLFEAIG